MQFKFPDVGEGIHEAKIVHINVKTGDNIEKDQIICEVETDKSVVEIPSPFSGTVKDIPHQIGDTIHVGDLLLEYVSNDQIETTNQKPETPTAPQPEPKKEGNVVGSLEDADSTPGDGTFDFSSYTPDTQAAPSNTDRKAELAEIQKHETAEEKIEQSIDPTNKEQTQATTNNIENLSGIRKVIAKNMRQTRDNTVTVTHFDEIDADRLVAKRTEMKKQGTKVSYLSLVIEAYCKALKEYPNFNASYDQANEQLIKHPDVNMAIAVDTEDGLMVPVIQNCENLNPVGITEAIINLAEKAKSRKLNASDQQGSTACITNYGSIGGKFATPVLNPGNIVNLGIGSMEEKIGFKGEHIHSHTIIPISFSYDHQIIDGAEAARFIKRLEELIN